MAVEPTTLKAADCTEVRRLETLERVESVWLKEDWLALMLVCAWALRWSMLWMLIDLQGRLGDPGWATGTAGPC